MTWNTYIRLRHITSGRYLGVVNGEVCVMHRDKANADAITFILIQTKVFIYFYSFICTVVCFCYC